MNVTLKMTLDGLVQALRWRQLDYLENPAQQIQTAKNLDVEVIKPQANAAVGGQNAQ